MAAAQGGIDVSGDGRGAVLPPFPPGYRASRVLLHVSSLPSPYGIGNPGSEPA